MRWEALTPENAVAKLRVASEHAISDFKLKYDTRSDPTKFFEIAKDVCAFANHLGGTIVVGAHEDKGTRKGLIAKFEELKDPSPGELVKDIERAIRLYCTPLPSANAIVISLSDAQVTEILNRASTSASIVAINVEPGFNTPYGCRSCSETCKQCKDAGHVCTCSGKEIADAYRFPIRFIEGTRFLRPDELAKTMNVAERRALFELQPLHEEEKIITVWFNAGDNKRSVFRPCRIVALDPSLMFCTLELAYKKTEDTPHTYRAEVPLTFVRATWQSSDGWHVAIEGVAFETTSRGGHAGFMPSGGIR